MILTIDTDVPLTKADAFMLRSLIEHYHPTFPVGGVVVQHRAADDVLPQDEPADKVQPQPKTVDPEKDRIAYAVDLGTALLAAGSRDKVKAALTAAGVSKIRDVDASTVEAFIEALEA